MTPHATRNVIAAVEIALGLGAGLTWAAGKLPSEPASIIAIVCISLGLLTASWRRSSTLV